MPSKKQDWKHYWREVRSTPCDVERFRKSLVWAILTVRTSVPSSERDFQDYCAYGGLRSQCLRSRRERAIREANAWVDRLDFERFRRLNRTRKLQAIVDNIYGLGYAKGSFALTCAGLADIACLDVHALRGKLGREVKAWRSADQYLKDCEYAFGRSRQGYRQWQWYYRARNSGGKAFRASNHAPFFLNIGIKPLTHQTALPLEGGD